MVTKTASNCFAPVKYRDEAYTIAFIDRNKEHIMEIRDNKNMRVAWQIANLGTKAEKLKLIEVLGSRIADESDQYGRSMAHALSRRADDNNQEVQSKIIDVLGEKIACTADNNGYTIAHKLAYEGRNEVRYKLIDIFGGRLYEIKDFYGTSVADTINKCAAEPVKNRMKSVMGKSTKEERKDLAEPRMKESFRS